MYSLSFLYTTSFHLLLTSFFSFLNSFYLFHLPFFFLFSFNPIYIPSSLHFTQASLDLGYICAFTSLPFFSIPSFSSLFPLCYFFLQSMVFLSMLSNLFSSFLSCFLLISYILFLSFLSSPLLCLPSPLYILSLFSLLSSPVPFFLLHSCIFLSFLSSLLLICIFLALVSFHPSPLFSSPSAPHFITSF